MLEPRQQQTSRIDNSKTKTTQSKTTDELLVFITRVVSTIRMKGPHSHHTLYSTTSLSMIVLSWSISGKGSKSMSTSVDTRRSNAIALGRLVFVLVVEAELIGTFGLTLPTEPRRRITTTITIPTTARTLPTIPTTKS